MRQVLESDTGFYYTVGAFTVAVFVIGLAIVGVTNPEAIGTRELVGFVVGFFLFMLVYFVSVSVRRLEGSGRVADRSETDDRRTLSRDRTSERKTTGQGSSRPASPIVASRKHYL